LTALNNVVEPIYNCKVLLLQTKVAWMELESPSKIYQIYSFAVHVDVGLTNILEVPGPELELY
jgi:hypothetical protein